MVAANKDFRVDTQIFGNMKIRKLRKELGDSGFVSLIALWAYTAAFAPNGMLTSMFDADIESAADWRGKRGQFVEVLLKLRFLDDHGADTYAIHDWAEHNAWALHAPERSEQARQRAHARWNNKGRSGSHATNARDYKMS